jgi:hypothetical protein
MVVGNTGLLQRYVSAQMSEFTECKRKKLSEHSVHTELQNFTSLPADAIQENKAPLKVKITYRIQHLKLFFLVHEYGGEKVGKESIKTWCPVSNDFLSAKRPFRFCTLNKRNEKKF